MDFHTHNQQAAPGTAIVNLPLDIVQQPETFRPVAGGLYSAGIHPWWTEEDDVEALFVGLTQLLEHPQVVALGECGLDRLRGGSMELQEAVFCQQVTLSETLQKPLIIHCVRAFDILLQLKKRLRPTQQWTIHGFRGRPDLSSAVARCGLRFEFRKQRNEESFALTPPTRRHEETDDDWL